MIEFKNLRPDEQRIYLQKARYLIEKKFVTGRTELELAQRMYLSEQASKSV